MELNEVLGSAGVILAVILGGLLKVMRSMDVEIKTLNGKIETLELTIKVKDKKIKLLLAGNTSKPEHKVADRSHTPPTWIDRELQKTEGK